MVNAGGITNELARRAWWVLQSAENARCMLRQAAVVEGDMGPKLAEFRITSYNVCYTKLLRVKVIAADGAAHGVRRPVPAPFLDFFPEHAAQ